MSRVQVVIIALGGFLVLLAGFALGVARTADSKSIVSMEEASMAPPPPPPPPEPAALGGAAALDESFADKPMALERKALKEVAQMAPARGRSGGGLASLFNAKGEASTVAFGGADALDGVTSPPAPTRAWFPETFLFAPSVITNDSGDASVDVLVPDRLTTYRVLALAHTRSGAQAGAITSLVSNLPVSIDVVTPRFLVAGDRIALPLQVTNNTDAALSRPLSATATGATISGVAKDVRVDAGASFASTAWLEAAAPGDISVEARLGTDDAIRRTVEVMSPGQPARVEKSGTLAQKRSFELALEPNVLPHSAIATLRVFPGALAILRSELASAPERLSVDDEAYLMALAAEAGPLSARLGAPVEPATLLRLNRVAAQRMARRARVTDFFSFMKLAAGGGGHDVDTLIGRTADHFADALSRMQRPDGTFAGGDGWTVQRVLMSTVDGVRALSAMKKPESAAKRGEAARVRARAAFERLAEHIDDPLTAAAVLASGALDESSDADLVKALREKVMTAVVARDDGAKALPVPEGVVRGDGTAPSEVETTALAILALRDHPPASTVLPDLGATVLSAYRPDVGFGDGATNRAALEAVSLLFAQPLPSRVVVSMTIDGAAAGSDTLEGKRLQEVMTLDAPLARAGEKIAVVVEADPPLPGLSYTLDVDYAVPWPAPPADAGLNVQVELPARLVVGESADVTLRAVAPNGAALHIVQGLPAGVDASHTALDALVNAGVLSRWDEKDGVLTLDTPPRRQGELFTAKVKVVPTLAGTLHGRVSSASIVGAPSTEVFFPPPTWTVAQR
jgi:hypothetical protein